MLKERGDMFFLSRLSSKFGTGTGEKKVECEVAMVWLLGGKTKQEGREESRAGVHVSAAV